MKPKQLLYKTAYAPMYDQYIKLVHSWTNGSQWYFYGIVKFKGRGMTIIFSEVELKHFCL